MTSARLDYGLRALLVLAASSTSLKSEEIASAAMLPRRFLDQVLGDLRRAGLLHSRRGGSGGYWLTRPAEDITVADVVCSLDGLLDSGGREDSPLAAIWATLERARLDAAAAISLRDLADRGPWSTSGQAAQS